jgi:hypothetical protein
MRLLSSRLSWLVRACETYRSKFAGLFADVPEEIHIEDSISDIEQFIQELAYMTDTLDDMEKSCADFVQKVSPSPNWRIYRLWVSDPNADIAPT